MVSCVTSVFDKMLFQERLSFSFVKRRGIWEQYFFVRNSMISMKRQYEGNMKKKGQFLSYALAYYSICDFVNMYLDNPYQKNRKEDDVWKL